MKKLLIILLVILIAAAIVLLLPIPKGSYDDGGTREYDALLYKLIVWNKIGTEKDGVQAEYHKTSCYWYPENKKSIDELWDEENPYLSNIENDLYSLGPDYLKKNYPEYCDLSDFKGLEVYIWSIAEDTFRCGLMEGTNRNKTQEEIWSLAEHSVTPWQMKIILAMYRTEDPAVFFFACRQPVSDYFYEIDDAYCRAVSRLFDNRYNVVPLFDRADLKITAPVDIIDKAERDGIDTAEAEEPFWNDENYTYIFPSIRSEYVVVILSDGSEIPVKEALANGIITVDMLDTFHVFYWKEDASGNPVEH